MKIALAVLGTYGSTIGAQALALALGKGSDEDVAAFRSAAKHCGVSPILLDQAFTVGFSLLVFIKAVDTVLLRTEEDEIADAVTT